jgi:hypothetical protein
VGERKDRKGRVMAEVRVNMPPNADLGAPQHIDCHFFSDQRLVGLHQFAPLGGDLQAIVFPVECVDALIDALTIIKQGA